MPAQNVTLDEDFKQDSAKRIPAGSSLVQDPPKEKLIDWLLSVKESHAGRRERKNRDGTEDIESPLVFPTWLKMKEGLRSDAFLVQGCWEYNTETNERSWIGFADEEFDLKKLELPNHQLSGRSFRTHEGDRDISFLYWNLWMRGETTKFITSIYEKYSNDSIIPEAMIWRIWRCFIGELVPENQKWTQIPDQIIANPETIWHVGTCIFQILTGGRYFDNEKCLIARFCDSKAFGAYKTNVLERNYSLNLITCVFRSLEYSAEERPTRDQLLQHFEKVFRMLDGKNHDDTGPTLLGPVWPEPYDPTPYEPQDSRIPRGLTKDEGAVYEKLIRVFEHRKASSSEGIDRIPHIFTITDIAKDYDDIVAMLLLKELHRLGIITLEGFVANLMPAEKRARLGRGALDSIGLQQVPIGVGSRGSIQLHDEQQYEFAKSASFMKPERCSLPEGQILLQNTFEQAVAEGRKITVLAISSLTDMAKFVQNNSELFKTAVSNVVLQGGYLVVNDVLTMDPAAQNNRFDEPAAGIFHEYLQSNSIKSVVYTKVAAGGVTLFDKLFRDLEDTQHPIGAYLRNVQKAQDINFYKRACSEKPFAPFMTQEWYVKTKSSWFQEGHEPDEPYPLGEDMVPFFVNIIAYDALAALGAAGDDVIEALDILKPLSTRKDAEHPVHQIVGVPAGNGKPADHNYNNQPFGTAISALVKGSLLSVQQGLETVV